MAGNKDSKRVFHLWLILLLADPDTVGSDRTSRQSVCATHLMPRDTVHVLLDPSISHDSPSARVETSTIVATTSRVQWSRLECADSHTLVTDECADHAIERTDSSREHTDCTNIATAAALTAGTNTSGHRRNGEPDRTVIRLIHRILSFQADASIAHSKRTDSITEMSGTSV